MFNKVTAVLVRCGVGWWVYPSSHHLDVLHDAAHVGTGVGRVQVDEHRLRLVHRRERPHLREERGLLRGHVGRSVQEENHVGVVPGPANEGAKGGSSAGRSYCRG